MSEEKSQDEYALKATEHGTVAAPYLPYLPPVPKHYRPKIGLIACGGITACHLDAYKSSGYEVAYLCDLDIERAQKRQAEFYPDAKVTIDYKEVLADDSIEVIDIATHPRERLPLIEAALSAKKHVLSQKPFVLSLDDGARLCDMADTNNVKFAVNQNGRWAPHFSYIREAVSHGVLGEVMSVHVGVHWDHTWVKGSPFEHIFDLIFYDFAIHWFDFVTTLVPGRAKTVYATRARAIGQELMPPMLAQAMVDLEGGGQISLVFDAHVKHGSLDRTFVAGTRGTILSTGPDISNQHVTLYTESGIAHPKLQGKWFNDGFKGTIGELICSIEENRVPKNSARSNLDSLALCFAAIESANSGSSKEVGSVRTLAKGSAPGV